MAKESGLGDRFYVGGYHLSGDTQAIKEATGSVALLDVTGIDKSAYERIGGQRDGKLSWTAFFNTAAGQAHPALSTLPTADVVVTYGHGTTLGNPAASLNAKQLNYDGSRGNEGMFTFNVDAQANGYGLVWGQQLTAGLRTDTAATNGTGVDTAASGSFGWAMAVHLTSFTGTSVTIKVQDSADNVSFADVTGATTTAMSAIGSQFIVSATSTATVRRYVRVATTGTFNPATFIVNFIKPEPTLGPALVF